MAPRKSRPSAPLHNPTFQTPMQPDTVSQDDHVDPKSKPGKRDRSSVSTTDSENPWTAKKGRTERGDSEDSFLSPPRLSKARYTNPWHGNDACLSRLNQQELNSLIRPQNVPAFPLGDDTYPIHPIFFMFMGSNPNACPPLTAALRLASRFLDSKHLLQFYHALMFGQLTPLQAEAAYYNTPIFHFPPSPYEHDGLPDDELLRTRQVLLALSRHIQVTQAGTTAYSAWAVTRRGAFVGDYPSPSDLRNTARNGGPLTVQQALVVQEGFHGTNATIDIDSCFMQIFTTPQPDDPAQLVPFYAQQVSCAYFLAVTLLHELAHAFWITRVPEPRVQVTMYPTAFVYPFQTTWNHPNSSEPEDLDPFYSNNRLNELGHAWESSVFHGGTITALGPMGDSPFQSGLGWWRWPYPPDATFLDPQGTIVPMARLIPVPQNYTNINPQGAGGRTLPPIVAQHPAYSNVPAGTLFAPRTHGRFSTIYVIPYRWIHRQFFANFWNTASTLPAQNFHDLFRPDRSLGVRLENSNFGVGTNGVGVVGGNRDGFDDDDVAYRQSILMGAVDALGNASAEGVVRMWQPFVPFHDIDNTSDSGTDFSL